MEVPSWLHLLEREARDGVQFAAIAIHRKWHHIGLLHRRAGNDHLSLLHLAWHFELKNEVPAPADYAWVYLPVSPLLARLVAANCRLVWNAHEKGEVPFGFEYEGTQFSDTGQLLLGDSAHGLTCATFVLAVLEMAGVRLLDLATWPSRLSDVQWQQTIIDALSKRGAPTEHLEALTGELGAVRYRPEEVCGATALPLLPRSIC